MPETLITPCGYDEPGSPLEVPGSPIEGVGILNYLQVCAVIALARQNPNTKILFNNDAFNPETAKRMAAVLAALVPDFPTERVTINLAAHETRGEIKDAKRFAISQKLPAANMIAIEYHFPRVHRNVRRLSGNLPMNALIMERVLLAANPEGASKDQTEVLNLWKGSDLEKRLRARELRSNLIDLFPVFGPMLMEAMGKRIRPGSIGAAR